MSRPPAPRPERDGGAPTSRTSPRQTASPAAPRKPAKPGSPGKPAAARQTASPAAPRTAAPRTPTSPRTPAVPRTGRPAPRTDRADRPTPRADRPERSERPGRPGRTRRPEPAPVVTPDVPDAVGASSIIGGGPRWVSGLLAGVQAALLSVLAVVVPAVAAYVATSADPTNADVGWTRAVAVGAALWLMGHGGALQVGDLALTIVPLGVTALALFCAHASARRSAYPTPSAWGAGVGGYLGSVLLVMLFAGGAGPLGAGPGSVVRTMVGAALVGAVGIGWGLLRPGRLAEVTRPVWSRVPEQLRATVRAGALAAAALLVAASVVVLGWALVGRAATGDVIEALGLDTFSGLVMAVAQLAYVPNLVVWAVAWLAGPGFAVGQGTVFSPAEVAAGPMPALPLLGALPAEPVGTWVPVLVAAAGALAGWWLHRRLEPRAAWQPWATGAGAGVVAGVVVALAAALASGSAGPGRMAHVGADALLVGATAAWLVALGALLVAVPTDAATRAAVRGWWSRLRSRGADAPAAPADDARDGAQDGADSDTSRASDDAAPDADPAGEA